MIRRIGKIALAAAVATVFVVGVFTFVTPAQAVIGNAFAQTSTPR